MKTTVRILKTFDDGGNLKGLASVNFDDCFAVTGIRIFESQNGLFVSMPNRKTGGNEYKDVAFPVTAEFRDKLFCEVLDAYHQKLEELQEHETENTPIQNKGGTRFGNQKQTDSPAAEEAPDNAQASDEETETLEESEGMSMRM